MSGSAGRATAARPERHYSRGRPRHAGPSPPLRAGLGHLSRRLGLRAHDAPPGGGGRCGHVRLPRRRAVGRAATADRAEPPPGRRSRAHRSGPAPGRAPHLRFLHALLGRLVPSAQAVAGPDRCRLRGRGLRPHRPGDRLGNRPHPGVAPPRRMGVGRLLAHAGAGSGGDRGGRGGRAPGAVRLLRRVPPRAGHACRAPRSARRYRGDHRHQARPRRLPLVRPRHRR